MAESYFKDPLLAKWLKACTAGPFGNDALEYWVRCQPMGHEMLAIDVYDKLPYPQFRHEEKTLRQMIRAELSGARRARDRATAIVERDTATEFQEGRFNAAREILEAFDGE